MLDWWIGSHSIANEWIPAVGAYKSLLPSQPPRKLCIHLFDGFRAHIWWRWWVPAQCTLAEQSMHTSPGSRCLKYGDFLCKLVWPYTAAHCQLHRGRPGVPSELAQPFSLPEIPQNLQIHDGDQFILTLHSSPYLISCRVETQFLLSKALDRSHPRDHRKLHLQCKCESHTPIAPLREPIVKRLPTYPSQHTFGDYICWAAFLLIQVTSQG